MPYYYPLKRYNAETRERVTRKLIQLRKALRAEVPRKTVDETLLLATWNIREFDSPGYGIRSQEAIFYLAEIASAFDVIAIQEVREDLTALRRLKKILGPEWDFVVTDVNKQEGGNKERMAFLYDKRKVWFKNEAGEIVLPADTLITYTPKPGEGKKQGKVQKRQFVRSPFVVAFQAGWLRFKLCTVHIFWDDKSRRGLEHRRQEIEKLATFLSERADDEIKKGIDEGYHYILLGDFNIHGLTHATMDALTSNGFEVPNGLLDSDKLKRDHFYDQIAFKPRKRKLELGDSHPNAGVFDFFDWVYRDDEEDVYRPLMGKYKLYKRWRTYQMSDHPPLWVELKIDFSEEYLKRLGK
ncbi:MAG: endonuclease/exonuclease/phosphatase family protein [Candidatus Zixiibacteriota bacterium]|jgi:hypothetical protein